MEPTLCPTTSAPGSEVFKQCRLDRTAFIARQGAHIKGKIDRHVHGWFDVQVVTHATDFLQFSSNIGQQVRWRCIGAEWIQCDIRFVPTSGPDQFAGSALNACVATRNPGVVRGGDRPQQGLAKL